MAAPPVPGLVAACEAAWRVGKGGERTHVAARGEGQGGEGSHAVPATSVWTCR